MKTLKRLFGTTLLLSLFCTPVLATEIDDVCIMCKQKIQQIDDMLPLVDGKTKELLVEEKEQMEELLSNIEMTSQWEKISAAAKEKAEAWVKVLKEAKWLTIGLIATGALIFIGGTWWAWSKYNENATLRQENANVQRELEQQRTDAVEHTRAAAEAAANRQRNLQAQVEEHKRQVEKHQENEKNLQETLLKISKNDAVKAVLQGKLPLKYLKDEQKKLPRKERQKEAELKNLVNKALKGLIKLLPSTDSAPAAAASAVETATYEDDMYEGEEEGEV